MYKANLPVLSVPPMAPVPRPAGHSQALVYEGPFLPSTAVGRGAVKKAGPLQPAGWRRWDMWRASSLVSRQVGLIKSCPQNLNSSQWYSPFKGAFLVASSSGALGWARTQQGGQRPAP